MSSVWLLLLLSATPAEEDMAVVPPLAGIGARFMIETAIGPYRPGIDGQVSGQTPYRDLFGGSSPLMYSFRVHYAVPVGASELGLGLGLGYFTDSANALTQDGERSAGRTQIRLIPVSVVARWRWLYMERWLGLPLAIHAAAGINYTVWRITKGDGEVAEVAGDRGEGGSLAAQLEVGMGLRLGRLDRRAAKILKNDFGLSDTEVGVSAVYVGPSFGWWDDLAIGDLTWRGYLTVSF